MALSVYDHGSCCGANVIDGFYCREVDEASYRRNPNYTEQQIADWTRSSTKPAKSTLLVNFINILTENRGRRGQFMIVLNDAQNEVLGEDLVKLFNCQLLYSDVSNPNHASDKRSRLWTYIWVARPYAGDRAAMKLDDPQAGRIPELSEIPGYTPPPPPFNIKPTRNINYGVRITYAAA